MDDEILSLGQTLIRMGINNGWWIENDRIHWVKEYEGYKPTEEEVIKKRDQLVKQDDYKRKRAKEYPPIEEQLDMLYHDIKNGATLDKEGRFFTTINKVKEKNPKKTRKTL